MSAFALATRWATPVKVCSCDSATAGDVGGPLSLSAQAGDAASIDAMPRVMQALTIEPAVLDLGTNRSMVMLSVGTVSWCAEHDGASRPGKVDAAHGSRLRRHLRRSYSTPSP